MANNSSTETPTAASSKSEADKNDSMEYTALSIIARETMTSVPELTDTTTFDELGVDSLMSAQFCDGFKTQLGLEIMPSLFVEYPDIGSLKGWIRGKEMQRQQRRKGGK